jgi:hypothetical protein
MGLAEVQVVLARLFVDEELRARFFSDPSAVGRSLGLDDREATGLAGLSPRHVSDFAAALRRKRVDDARKIVPLTASALGDRFAPLLLASIEGALPRGRHRDDARSLAAHLMTLSRVESFPIPWAGDLARYELAFGEALTIRAGLITRRFRFPVRRLAEAIHHGVPIPSVRAGLTIGIWLRIPGRRGVVHRLLFS